MEKCLVILLCFEKDKTRLCSFDLPFMMLPQQMLPAEARFAGVGTMGGEDAYLYTLHGTAPRGAVNSHPAMEQLKAIAAKEKPQQFELAQKDGQWTLDLRDLDEDVYNA